MTMPKNYTDITRSVSTSLRGWRSDLPALVNGFNALSEAVFCGRRARQENEGADRTCARRRRALRCMCGIPRQGPR
jgi:hypothetical protein